MDLYIFCVFQAVKECFARHSLVEIIVFSIFNMFSISQIPKREPYWGVMKRAVNGRRRAGKVKSGQRRPSKVQWRQC